MPVEFRILALMAALSEWWSHTTNLINTTQNKISTVEIINLASLLMSIDLVSFLFFNKNTRLYLDSKYSWNFQGIRSCVCASYITKNIVSLLVPTHSHYKFICLCIVLVYCIPCRYINVCFMFLLYIHYPPSFPYLQFSPRLLFSQLAPRF